MPEALREGKSCWIDIDVPDRKEVEDTLKSLGINKATIKLTAIIDERHQTVRSAHIGLPLNLIWQVKSVPVWLI